jgi:hypothetical protein
MIRGGRAAGRRTRPVAVSIAFFFFFFFFREDIGTYHVERHDILERDLPGAVPLHQDLVDDLGATPGGQTDHEGLVFGGFEGFDATDDVVGDVVGDRQRILSDNDSPAEAVSRAYGVCRRDKDIHGELRELRHWLIDC